MHALSNVKVSRDDERWEVEIKAEIPAEELEEHRAEALKEIQASAKLDGFRPGKAPLERILQVYGESAVLKRAAENAVGHVLPELLAKESILAIEPPHVTMEAPQSGKPLPFTARAALAPRVELPDYTAIAKKHPPENEPAVSDEEHREALTHLRRERSRIEKMEAGAEPQKASEESRAVEEKELPELDDTFVQSLGYENASVFSEKLRENIKNEKVLQAKEKRRAAILEDLMKDARISYPALLREYELDDMEARMKDDLARVGASFEQYLAQLKKTREEVRTEWKEVADKRTKTRLILAEIARKENLDADPKELAHQLEHAKKHFPQAKPEVLHANLAHAMKNEAVLKFLENV